MVDFNYDRLQARADALHANAKNGTLKLGDVVYTFTFDAREGVYVVTDPDGVTLMRYNTAKLTRARQWLREYFAS